MLNKTFRRLGLVLAVSWLPVANADPVNVRVIALAEVLKTRNHSAPATVVARNAPLLAAEIDARVVALDVAVGDQVAAGQVLVRLDCRSYASTLAAAEAAAQRAAAQLAFARAQLTRARNLKKNRNISEELLDQRGNELALAEADRLSAAQTVERARIDHENCEVRAPFDAVVTERQANVGGYATRGSPLLALLETAGQEVRSELRHDQVESLLQAGQPAFVAGGRSHPVRLRALLPAADPVALTREARFGFTAQPAIVGSAGRLAWRGSTRLVPPEYLVRRAGAIGLFVLDADSARFVPLDDAQDGRPAPVSLPPDTLLITDGRQVLEDGAPVRVVATEAPAR